MSFLFAALWELFLNGRASAVSLHATMALGWSREGSPEVEAWKGSGFDMVRHFMTFPTMSKRFFWCFSMILQHAALLLCDSDFGAFANLAQSGKCLELSLHQLCPPIESRAGCRRPLKCSKESHTHCCIGHNMSYCPMKWELLLTWRDSLVMLEASSYTALHLIWWSLFCGIVHESDVLQLYLAMQSYTGCLLGRKYFRLYYID